MNPNLPADLYPYDTSDGSSIPLEEDIIYQKLVEIDTKCKKIREKINEY